MAVELFPSAEQTRPRRGLLLAVLLSGQFMVNVDGAVVNIAAPTIRTGLGTGEGPVALVVSGYLIAYAVLLVTGARLGATHGRRRIFLWGLAGFTAASLACGVAPGIEWLIVARFLQGAAGALMVPQVLSGIQTHFTGADRGRALGYYAVALSGGAVAGQVLGGLLVSADLFGTGWRSVFLINVPVGVGLLLAARRALPADSRDERGTLDLPGAGVLSAAVLLAIVPLVLGREHGWPTWMWLCLAASLVVFGWFVRHCKAAAGRGKRPLIALDVVADSVVRNGLLAHGLTTATYAGLLFVLALYLQQGVGVGPAETGLAMVSWVAAFGVAGLALPRLPARWRRFAPAAGCLLLAIAYASLCIQLSIAGHPGPPLILLLGLGGLGLGVSSNSLIDRVTSTARPDRVADLSGVLNTNAQLCAALGVAGASTAYLGLPFETTASFATVLGGFAGLALIAAAVALGTERK
ncbi:MFS transporter [Amycolatopsis sp. NPDC059090]|uniref:MFS transporter n=1 Tax=unclassified Amycolatopsis TaxID=2618356 RepID=UPI00366D9577